MSEKNKMVIGGWVIGTIVVFLGISFFFWTLVPHMQMKSYKKSIQNASSERSTLSLLDTFRPTAFMFEPETYVQGFVRQSFMNQIFIQYNGGAFANKDLRPLIDSAIAVGVSYSSRHPDPYFYVNIAKLYDIQYALSGDSSYFDNAEAYFQRALTLMPSRQDILSSYATHSSIKKPQSK